MAFIEEKLSGQLSTNDWPKSIRWCTCGQQLYLLIGCAVWEEDENRGYWHSRLPVMINEWCWEASFSLHRSEDHEGRHMYCSQLWCNNKRGVYDDLEHLISIRWLARILKTLTLGSGNHADVTLKHTAHLNSDTDADQVHSPLATVTSR